MPSHKHTTEQQVLSVKLRDIREFGKVDPIAVGKSSALREKEAVLEDRLYILVMWRPVKDQAFLAHDTLGLQPPLAVVETLGQSLVLEILDLSDEVSVQSLASSPLEHPEEGSLRGNVEDIKGVGKVCVILWLHIVDPDGASYLVRRKIKLLEDVRFVLCKHKLLVEDRCEVLLQSFFWRTSLHTSENNLCF